MMKNTILKKYLKEIYFRLFTKEVVIISILSIMKTGIVLIPPIYIMKILDEAIPDENIRNVILFSAVVLLFTISTSLLDILLASLYNALSKKVTIYYQKKCILHMYNLYGNDLSNMSTGKNFTTIIRDINQIRTLVSPTNFNFISDLIIAITMLVFLLYLQWDLLIIVMVILPIIYWVQSYFQRKGREAADEAREAYGLLMSILDNIISNIFNGILCNGKKFFLNKYNSTIDAATNKEIKMQMIFAKNSSILSFLSVSFTIIILGYGGYKVIDNTLTIGGLIAFNMYAQKLVNPLLTISRVLMDLNIAAVSLEKIENFLKKEEVKKSNDSIESYMQNEWNRILFQDVSFHYDNQNIILNKMNLEIKQNGFNIIVGKSGCGKSTLLSLLYRLWDVEQGCIKIDGIDIREYGIEFLRNNITIIGQEPFLFNDTILNNITLDKDVDIETVEKYARMACIHDYIMTLPDKYNSLVGEKGIKLSGGEKQRICLARAFIRDTKIIILDEATSALDQMTEKNILEHLSSESNNKIIILITHRMHSIIGYERIYVLNEGQCIGQGSHYELLAKCAYYRKLYENEEAS